MARPKSNASASTVNSVVVEDKEKNAEPVKAETVENTVKAEKVEKKETVPETKTEKKEKTYGDDDEVKIVCQNLAGRSVSGLDGKVYVFDGDGYANVLGKDAKRFLTIPGYELAK